MEGKEVVELPELAEGGSLQGLPECSVMERPLTHACNGNHTLSKTADVGNACDGKYDINISETCSTKEVGKVCILSIDGGGMRGIIPSRVLAYLEEALKLKSGDSDAKIADYFDVAAGTSVGGLITTMLFTKNRSGGSLFSGEECWKLIVEKGKYIFKVPKCQRCWRKCRGIMTPRYSTKNLENLLKHYLIRDGRALTLKDTLKPVLIPCYDLETAGALIFSRADAFETETSDFKLWEVCRATSAVPAFFKPALLSSVDGKTTCTAIDGGLVMNNPTAAAITHVLHNKEEFPNVRDVNDLLILSLGTGQFDQTYRYKKVRRWGAFQWVRPVVKIIFDGISDMVDHTVSMSFKEDFRSNYVRVQVSGCRRALTEMDDGGASNVNRLMKIATNSSYKRAWSTYHMGAEGPCP